MLTDRIEDTVDYGEVADIVTLAATERSYRTLERLAHVIGERLIERFDSDSVRVRAAKPEPPLPLSIEEVAVEVARAGDRRRGDRRGGRARGARREPAGFLGLGSNVGDRAGHLRAAIAALGERGVEVEAVSSAYETEPVGEILDQPDFLNAAVEIRDRARARGAARRLQADRGRARPRVGGPSATGRGRSTSTCCCSASSSSRPSG